MTDKQKMDLFKSTSKVPTKLKDMATFLTDECCLNLDGSPIVGDDRNKIIYTMGRELHIGEVMTKNKYLLIGGLAGAVVFSAVGIFVGYKYEEHHTLKALEKKIKSPEFKKQISEELDDIFSGGRKLC